MPQQLQWDPGRPARGRVVLLHGMTSQAATWWRIGPALAARGWQAVALDLPGHGAMPRLARPLDLDTLVEGVAERLPGPVDLLVGHSLGAIVALALAGRQPATARALVLEDPPGPCGADPAALADTLAADAALVRADRDRLLRRERDANPRWALTPPSVPDHPRQDPRHRLEHALDHPYFMRRTRRDRPTRRAAAWPPGFGPEAAGYERGRVFFGS